MNKLMRRFLDTWDVYAFVVVLCFVAFALWVAFSPLPARGQERPSVFSTGRLEVGLGPLTPSGFAGEPQRPHARAWVTALREDGVSLRVGYPGVQGLRVSAWCPRQSCPGRRCYVTVAEPSAVAGTVGGKFVPCSLSPGCVVGWEHRVGMQTYFSRVEVLPGVSQP